MTTNDRDTHFQGFAEMLCSEYLLVHLLDNPYFVSPKTRDEIVTLIAQRAYDLMEHIMLYAPAVPVPDLTEWPG